MKKIGLLLMVIALIGTMSCNGGKSVDTDTLCAEKVAAAVQAACDSIRAAQPVRETKLVEATRAEEGNVSYTLYQSPEQPTTFIFYEAYKDAAAFETHASSEHFKAFADAITDLLDGDLLVEKF